MKLNNEEVKIINSVEMEVSDNGCSCCREQGVIALFVAAKVMSTSTTVSHNIYCALCEDCAWDLWQHIRSFRLNTPCKDQSEERARLSARAALLKQYRRALEAHANPWRLKESAKNARKALKALDDKDYARCRDFLKGFTDESMWYWTAEPAREALGLPSLRDGHKPSFRDGHKEVHDEAEAKDILQELVDEWGTHGFEGDRRESLNALVQRAGEWIGRISLTGKQEVHE